MAVKFANLASSTLASSLSNTATSISVTSSSSFPTLGSGDYFYASIGESSGSEIVKVTGVSSNTFTVVRGQDGTSAQNWSSGSTIALRVVAAALDDIASQAQTAADTESVSIAGDTMTGSLTTPGLTVNGNAILGSTASNYDQYVRGNSNVGLRIQTNAQGTTSSDGMRIGLNGVHAFVWQYEALPLAFATSGIERLSISATGGFDFKGNTLSSGAITAPSITATSAGMSVFSTSVSTGDDWQNSPISIRERGAAASSSNTSDTYAPNLNFHWAPHISRSIWMRQDGSFNFGEYGAGQGSATSSLSALNADSYKILNTTVIDSSRNITAGTISSGSITATGNLSLSGDSRKIEMLDGTTNSQPSIAIGEQSNWGVRQRWDSGQKVIFEGWWASSTSGAVNRDFGYLDAYSKKWRFNDYVGINVDANTTYRLYVNGNIRADGAYYVGGDQVITSAKVLTNIASATVTNNLSAGSITSGYGLSLTNGNTDFLLYNNTNENVLYMRDTTNGQMLQTWHTDKVVINTLLLQAGRLTTSGSGTSTDPVIGITATNSQTFIHASNAFAANMTAAQFNGHFFGKAGSTKNAGAIGYYWAASGSDANFVSIGHWGNDHLLRIYGQGNVDIASGNLFIQGTQAVQKSGNYMVLLDGGGSAAIYAGSTSDNRNYYQSNHHRFRNDGATLDFGEISADGWHIGGVTTPTEKLTVTGNAAISGNVTATRFRSTNGASNPYGVTFSNVFSAEDSSTRVAYFDGRSSSASVWWGNGTNAHGAIDSNDGLMSIWVNPSNNSWYKIQENNTSGLNITTGGLMVGGATAIDSSRQFSGSLASSVTAATQSASDNSTKVATTAYVTTAIDNIVDAAPGSLDTLNELAAALGDDANFSTTVTNSIATKLPLAGGTMTGELKSTSTSSQAIKTRFIAGAANNSTADGPLYLQYGRGQDIRMFEASGQNRNLYIYGNDNGTDRWGSLSVGTDGSFNVTASDTYLLLNAASYIQSNRPHNFTSSLLTAGNVWLDSNRNATFNTLSSGAITGSGLIKGTYNAGNTGWSNVVIDAAPAAGGAFIRANRASASSGEVGFAWANGGSNQWINYLATSGSNLQWYAGGSAFVMSLTSGGLLNTTGGYQVNGTTVIDSNKKFEFVATANGTLASRTGFSDFIGYNASYGSYIGGGAANAGSWYLYSGGYINAGGTVYSLLHTGNDSEYMNRAYLSGSTTWASIASNSSTNVHWIDVVNTSATDRPQDGGGTNAYPYGIGMSINQAGRGALQIYTPEQDNASGGFFYRTGWNGTLRSWQRVFDDEYHPEADNADTVDNLHASQFLRSDAGDTATGSIVFSGATQYFRKNDATNYTNGSLMVESYGGSSSIAAMGFHISGSIGRMLSMNSSGTLSYEGNFVTQGAHYVQGSLNVQHTSHNYLYLNSTASLEQMVRFKNGLANDWYAGLRTSAGLVSTADFHIYSAAYGNDVFAITTGGNAVVANDVVATGIYNNTSSSGLKVGGFADANTDETAGTVVTWLRSGSWDNYLIKGSSSRGVFSTQFIGEHIDSSKSWGVFSSGWDTELQVNGDGRTYLKGPVGIGSTPGTSDARLRVTGLNNTQGTVNLIPDSNKGTRESHIHYGSTGDWYIRSASTGGTVHIQDGSGAVLINSNTAWHAGNDGSGSGLDADLLDGHHKDDFDHFEKGKKWTGINASGTQARRFHIARLYGCPAHWDSNWQNIEFHVTAETYESGTLKFRMQGDYNGGNQNTWLSLYLTEAHGPLVGDFRFVMGTATAAGWNNSGQPTYYIDLFAEARYYAGFTVHAKTYGHSYQTSNPVGGGAITVFYSSPTVTNITDFGSQSHMEPKHRGYTVWNAGNHGSGSGLDADFLDGQHGSYYATASNLSGHTGNSSIHQNWGLFSTNGGQDFLGRGKRVAVATTSNLILNYGNDFTNITVDSPMTVNGAFATLGNTNLGNGNGDTTHVNDILYVGATDSGDSHFYFGENSGNWYGEHWYWDSGHTTYRYSRHAGTDTLIEKHDTRYTHKIQTNRAYERLAHSTGYQIGSYNSVGGNSNNSNPIYVIGDNYRPTDTSLSNMYGIGYAHPNLWGSDKTSDWGLYVANSGGVNATIGAGAITAWFQNDVKISSTGALRTNRYENTDGTFMFKWGTNSGTSGIVNFSEYTSDPSAVGSNSDAIRGITWGQRTDNNPYYMIYPRYYANGRTTHARLVLAWHTGIEIGAEHTYGGTRFFNNSPQFGSVIMSVGDGDQHVRVTNNLLVGGSLDADAKRHDLGASSSWDSVGFSHQTNLHFQGHNQFWIGAGNGTWFTGTGNSRSQASGLAPDGGSAHDLLLTTMQATSAYDRGITFGVDNNGAGTGGWRLGKWHSGDARDSSKLVVDGQIFAKGGYTDEYDYYANDYSAYYSSQGGTAQWTGDGGWQVPGIVSSTAIQIQSGNGGTNSRKPQLQFHQYGYGGILQEYDGPNKVFHIKQTSSTHRLTHMELTTHYGNLQMGPMNSSYCHIYTSIAGGFYFNRDNLYANGNTIWHAGNDGASSGLDADLLDNVQGINYARRDIYNSCDSGLQVFRNLGTATGSWQDGSHTMSLENNDNGYISLNFHRGGYTSHNLLYTGSNFQFDQNVVSTGNVTAYSDERLKDNIEVIPNAVEKINQLRGITYTRTDLEDTEKRYAGVIAQEVEKVLPEVVDTAHQGIKHVAYGNMVGLLIEAIKEQSAQIESLNKRIEELENGNN